MSGGAKWLLASVLVALALFLVLRRTADRRPARGEDAALVVYCAAGLKPPIEAAARAYEQASGVTVQLQYGGSGTLLSNLRVAGRGDLFVAADNHYLELARTHGLLAESIPLAHQVPVIAVPKGNPARVQSVEDLLRLRVALANPDAAAVGAVVRELLGASGLWTRLEQHTRVFKPTVTDVANDVKLGAVDAGIVWDATVRQYPELEAVAVPEFAKGRQEVAIGVLKSARHPAAALRFARFVGAPEKGLPEFARLGYQPVEGDAWVERPRVVLFSGGVNRLAIEETLRRFEEREGVEITRVYNGCGILVSQMKAGQHPDAYFACDVSFMTDVADLFLDPLDVSETDMVVLVGQGNPKAVRTLVDLAQPGLRLGIANPQQSALGALTERLLRGQGLWDRVLPNVRVQTPTADLLVNQMRTGALDAAVVYEVNTSEVRDQLTVVPIGRPEATAIQPYAVGRNSKHRQLMQRLLAALESEASRQRYEALGFRWRADRK